MRIALIFLLLAGLLAWLMACKTNKKTTENANTQLVELKTSGCFGFCPVFRLTFWNNKNVEFEGINFTQQKGIKTFELTDEELAQLRAKVLETNVWQFPDRFESTVQDAPGATITVFEPVRPGQPGGKDKKKSTHGTIDRPKTLLDLEGLMKNLAEKHGLNVSRGVDPNEPQPGARAEIIVKLDEKLNAGNWIAQFTDLRLQLVRRIPPENTWVVAFDTTQIDEKTLIDFFKNIDGVILAQPNMKVKDRN